MVAETYNDVATYMQAKNVTLVAKSSGYDVKKESATVKLGNVVVIVNVTSSPRFTKPSAASFFTSQMLKG